MNLESFLLISDNWKTTFRLFNFLRFVSICNASLSLFFSIQSLFPSRHLPLSSGYLTICMHSFRTDTISIKNGKAARIFAGATVFIKNKWITLLVRLKCQWKCLKPRLLNKNNHVSLLNYCYCLNILTSIYIIA